MSDTLIVFSALVLPDTFKREIISVRNSILQEYGISYSGFEREEKLHVTLKYFGEIGAPALHDIFLATEQVEKAAPFELYFTGFSVIFNRKVPKILYANVSMPPQAFVLVNELEHRYKQIGFDSDTSKQFLPHITIKRIRMNGDERFIQNFPEKFENPKSFWIEKIAVFESIRTQKGSSYKYLKTYNLEG